MLRCGLLLIISFCFCAPLQAKRSELVIATTFSPQATAHILHRWQRQSGALPVRTINRTSSSLKQLLDNAAEGYIDLVLTSSPMLLQHLQERQRLAQAPALSQKQPLLPRSIQRTSVAVALSGFGLLINRHNLANSRLAEPQSWEDLMKPRYRDMLLMSSPSRSDTNHLMIEALLQQYGWQRGWQILLTVAGNLSAISSRSFSVADNIQSGLSSIGPVIDSYAQLLSSDPHLTFSYFANSIAAPTYVAITRDALYPEQAEQFIRFLLSEQGQKALADTNTGKYPINPLHDNSPRAQQQRQLLQQAPLDYDLLLARQRLVQLLFDAAISFRLPQIKDAWLALDSAQERKKMPLADIAARLTAVPISEAQSCDPQLLQQCSSRAGCEQLMIEWQQFFHQQQRQVIQLLENLK